MQTSATTPRKADSSWNIRYFLLLLLLAILWLLAWNALAPLAAWLVGLIPGIGARLASSLEFFIYDSLKILMLLAALIYGLAWLRAGLNVDRVRDYLSGKKRSLGYFLGAFFGAVTPFCSCSSIPLFLGFTAARIPFGATMAFLIASPLINEIAIVLLWGLLGWQFTVTYVLAGLLAAIAGGFFMDAINAGRWLQPAFLETVRKTPPPFRELCGRVKLTPRDRHNFAFAEASAIFRRMWKWVLIGVALGAAMHGFVPQNWFAEHLGAGQWWTVPLAVLAGIPLYANVTGIVPVMESLLAKGMPLGTTMAFCMSAVAASIPEVLMLRQIMTLRLQAVFILYLWAIFTLMGWLFNLPGPWR